jgi:hypothetical protein
MTTWTWKRLALFGLSELETRVGGIRVAIEWSDGGGYAPSVAKYRVNGRLVAWAEGARA